MTDTLGPAMMGAVADRPVAAHVGREDCLESLAAELHRAADGHPRVVVVCGETGVGKTRLVGEFLRRERPRALLGACVPVAGEALPFAALAQGLRRLSEGPERRHLQGRPDLLGLLGEGAEDPDDSPRKFGQLRLYQSVLGLLGRLGHDRPVVHVVEDLHWADRATLDLVRFLATNLVHEHVLVVLTYRVDVVTEASPVHGWLAELGRLPRVNRITVERLDPDHTTRLVSALAGPAVNRDLISSIVARSDGNPLFVQHLVWHAVEHGDGLPEALEDLLAARLAALPKVTSEVVGAAAVLARNVTVPLLAATTGRTLDEVEDALPAALDHHVLRLTEDEFIDFAHPAFREVAYGRVLPSRRARLHRAAAEAIAGADVAVGAGGELARHWQLAGDLPRALDAALAAGYAAERIPAFADAYANFVRVLDLLDRIDHEVDRVEVLEHAARAARLLGDEEEAARLLQAALATPLEEGRRAGVLEELGYVHFIAGHGPEAEEVFRQAITLLPPDDQSVLGAKVHAGLGLLLASWSRVEEAESECAAALSAARSVGAKREEGRARNARGLLAAARGEPEEAVAELRAALDLARESADTDDLSAAYVNLGHVLGLVGRLPEAVEVCREGAAAMTRLGLGRHLGTLLMANGAESLIKLGRYEEADGLMRRALELHPRGIMAAVSLLRAAQLCLVRGEIETATRHCEQAVGIVEVEEAPPSWLRDVAEVAAEVELWARRPQGAVDAVLRGLRAMRGTDEEALCSWLLCLGLRALGDLRESRRDPAARLGQADLLEELLRLTRAHPERAGHHDPPETAAWIATAEAERARVLEETDPQLWVAAHGEWTALSRPLPAAYARWREAEARLASAVDDVAIATLRAAEEDARRIGVVPLLADIDRLARWYRVDLFSPEGVDAAADEDALAAYALTPREQEVLAGLVAGRTNHELATTLGMSTKTASVHVSNILRKLEVGSRQDAARVAHRLGVRG